MGWPVSTWNPEKSVWPEGKWPTLEAPEPDPTPPPVASSRGLGAIDLPGEAGAATEEGDPPTTMSWGGGGGQGGVSNNMLHRGQNNL